MFAQLPEISPKPQSANRFVCQSVCTMSTFVDHMPMCTHHPKTRHTTVFRTRRFEIISQLFFKFWPNLNLSSLWEGFFLNSPLCGSLDIAFLRATRSHRNLLISPWVIYSQNGSLHGQEGCVPVGVYFFTSSLFEFRSETVFSVHRTAHLGLQ